MYPKLPLSFSKNSKPKTKDGTKRLKGQRVALRTRNAKRVSDMNNERERLVNERVDAWAGPQFEKDFIRDACRTIFDLAFLSAIESIEARLPEEKERRRLGNDYQQEHDIEVRWFNECLRSIKSLLAEVKKETNI